MENMLVPTARPGSWEQILHEISADNKLLLLAQASQTREMVQQRGQHAIGGVYHPEDEHLGNYLPTVLPRRNDAFLYLDETEALHLLRARSVEEDEEPEIYLTGV